MSETILINYGLNQREVRELLRDVERQLLNTGGYAEAELASIFSLYNFDLRDPNAGMAVKDTVELIGAAVSKPEVFADQRRLRERNPNARFIMRLPDEAYEWGKKFIREVLKEVRKSVCAKQGEYSKLREEYVNYPKALATAISAAVFNVLGVADPIGLGIATLILLTLSRVTRNAFCNMTDDQVIQSIDAKVTESRKSR